MASRKRRSKSPAESRKKPAPEESAVPAESTDVSYGSGNRSEESDADAAPRPHNNYDGYDRSYPPSQER